MNPPDVVGEPFEHLVQPGRIVRGEQARTGQRVQPRQGPGQLRDVPHVDAHQAGLKVAEQPQQQVLHQGFGGVGGVVGDDPQVRLVHQRDRGRKRLRFRRIRDGRGADPPQARGWRGGVLGADLAEPFRPREPGGAGRGRLREPGELFGALRGPLGVDLRPVPQRFPHRGLEHRVVGVGDLGGLVLRGGHPALGDAQRELLLRAFGEDAVVFVLGRAERGGDAGSQALEGYFDPTSPFVAFTHVPPRNPCYCP